ncbi:MAG: hypothetical protein K2H40_01220, partial [Lachnospiraceae bacterium]|nr:hypothetical protein [Lachnospiraceae bacterium]
MALRRKRNGKIAKILSLVILTVSLGGCGTAGSGEGGSGPVGNSSGQGGELSPEAMGRYVEEASDLSAKISGDGSGIYPLNNGNLIVTDRYTEFIKTDNNGAIWMTDHRRWRTKMLEEGIYIMSMAVGPDNTVALIYQGDAEEAEGARDAEEADNEEAVNSSDGVDSGEEADSSDGAGSGEEADTSQGLDSGQADSDPE